MTELSDSPQTRKEPANQVGTPHSKRLHNRPWLGVVGARAGNHRFNAIISEAVKERGPAVVSIFRPAMIVGSRHTPWLLEKLLPAFSFVTPAKYRSIPVEQIAKAMIATSLNPPAKSDVYQNRGARARRWPSPPRRI